MKKGIIITLIRSIIMFIAVQNTFAEEPKEVQSIELQPCEEVMLNAFSIADEKLEEKYAEMLNLEGFTAVSKSQTINTYHRTYTCHANAICSSVRNAKSGKKFAISSNQNECHPTTIEDFEKELGEDINFDSCKNIDSSATNRYFARCDAFAAKKINNTTIYLQKEFIKEVHLESQTLLAQKILDLRDKMEILIEKVRAFSTHFNKIIDDIDCTSPDPSGK